VAAKKILGFKEVNLACKRILHELCDELNYKHHKSKRIVLETILIVFFFRYGTIPDSGESAQEVKTDGYRFGRK
jgi:hypothetical protein